MKHYFVVHTIDLNKSFFHTCNTFYEMLDFIMLLPDDGDLANYQIYQRLL